MLSSDTKALVAADPSPDNSPFSELISVLELVVNRAIPAGKDSTGQDMVKMRAAIIPLLREALAKARR